MSLYLGENLISGIATPIQGARNIGQIIQSTLPLSDAGLHLLDGALIDGSGIYSDFVDYIADLYNNDNTEIMYAWKTIDEEDTDAEYVYTKTSDITNSTVLYNADGTIYNKADYPRYEIFRTRKLGNWSPYHVWYFLTAEGSSSADYRVRSSINSEENIYNFSQNFLTTEKEWQQSVTNYGVCGKFVYDSVNNTVRLPKITGFVEGTINITTIGDLIEAGLPNITGEVAIQSPWTSASENGALKTTTQSGSFVSGQTSQTWTNRLYFDASHSNSIYGNSDTVQPQSIKVFYYIVIATSTKTNIEVDIDEITTDLNGKADVDLSNMNASQTAKEIIVSWGMPDWSAGIDIAVPVQATPYICPSNGVYVFCFLSNVSGSTFLYINGVKTANIISQSTNYNRNRQSSSVVLAKDDVIYFNQSATDIYSSTFYPLKGVN